MALVDFVKDYIDTWYVCYQIRMDTFETSTHFNKHNTSKQQRHQNYRNFFNDAGRVVGALAPSRIIFNTYIITTN